MSYAVLPKKFLADGAKDWITRRVPSRWKRLVYAASIVGLTSFLEKPDIKLLEKINLLFGVASRADRINVPIFLRDLIWKDVIGKTIQVSRSKTFVRLDKVDTNQLTGMDIVEVCNYLDNHCPSWLRYGSDELMRFDAFRIFTEACALRFPENDFSQPVGA